MTHSISSAQALKKAAAFCAASERCVADVQGKLSLWGVPAAEQQTLIERLIAEKFIDEARYASAFVRDKFQFNGWGTVKIGGMLRRKQLPEYVIVQALETIDEDDYQQKLAQLIATKRKQLKTADPYQCNAQLFRFAASRGFEHQLIAKILQIE
ncbi:MAG: RecX family transcriptional regulator [Prevotellaceae bacterium]|jgi:regulatory protein|nr:RecX family transcriptional regulator [Prevotellaceae bacterium]